jgi:hypothetical protein
VVLAWKRQHQRVEAARAKRARQLLWEKKPKHVREQDAECMIQSIFRARQARKMVHALRLIKMDREYIATLKIQYFLRKKLRQKREYLQMKREELIRLQSIKEKELSDKQKLRMYELQDVLNRKLLLRPNTSFAVYWKIFFAICLIWELANAAAKPWLFDVTKKESRTNNSDMPATLVELMAERLVPTRVTELSECQEFKNAQKSLTLRWFRKSNNSLQGGLAIDNRPWYCSDPYATIQESFRDVVALALVPVHVSEFSECKLPKEAKRLQQSVHSTPWYCEYKSSHAAYRFIVDVFWKYFAVGVGIAYFLDVFITLFTGEFHPESGVLMPKPFIQRWVLPGLGLKLLVNPYMNAVSEWTFEVGVHLLDYGPIRVWRWIATVSSLCSMCCS